MTHSLAQYGRTPTRLLMAFVLAIHASVTIAEEVRISHMFSDIIQRGEGIMCAGGDPQTSFDASFWNAYTLSEFDIDSGLQVDRIEFGVELLDLPSRQDATLTINLYVDVPRSAPTIGLPLLATASIDLQAMALEIVSVDIDAFVPADSALIVELAVPSFGLDGLTGDFFLPGGNAFGRTAETYISSVACGIFEPTGQQFGWPFSMVKTVFGRTVCPADIDEDGELSIFDFLAFQTLFDTGDPRADFDGDGDLTLFDFLAFQNAFDAGCCHQWGSRSASARSTRCRPA